MENEKQGSDRFYRAMIYSAITTFFIYSDGIDTACEKTTEFREKNPAAVKRIFEEILSVFNYELSWNQVDIAIAGYLTAVKKPQNASNTGVYKLNPA